MKCKKKTSNIEENKIITDKGRTQLKSKCKECNTSKSQFIPTEKKQSGGAEIHATLSDEAYKDLKDARDNIDGYILDRDLSKNKSLVYHNPEKNDTITAHRGTASKHDVAQDLLISTGLYNSKTSKDVKLATEVAKNAQTKYKDSTQTQTGHSKGGTTAKQVQSALNPNTRIEAYNAGASPVDIVKNVYTMAKCKINPNLNACKRAKNTTDNITVVDPISISNLSSPGKVKITKPSKVNTHSLDNFRTVPIQVGGCDCELIIKKNKEKRFL